MSIDDKIDLSSATDYLPPSIFIPLSEPGSAFFTYFGGMYVTECFDMNLSTVPALLEFDAALPLSGVAFVPGTMAVDISGVYHISYEIMFTSIVYSEISAQILSHGKRLPSADATLVLPRNSTAVLNHSTFARLSAFDELELELSADAKETVLIRQAQLTIMRIGI